MVNFLYRVRDLRPRWSTRRQAGFSCATLYNQDNTQPNDNSSPMTGLVMIVL